MFWNTKGSCFNAFTSDNWFWAVGLALNIILKVLTNYFSLKFHPITKCLPHSLLLYFVLWIYLSVFGCCLMHEMNKNRLLLCYLIELLGFLLTLFRKCLPPWETPILQKHQKAVFNNALTFDKFHSQTD